MIVEWNTVAICLIWVLTFAWEWKYLTLILLVPPSKSKQVCEVSGSNVGAQILYPLNER